MPYQNGGYSLVMTKHLLFVPFIALLATSCGGGHITTTPVVKNAPSVSLTPTHRDRPTPNYPNSGNSVTFSVSGVVQSQPYYICLADGNTYGTMASLPDNTPYLYFIQNAWVGYKLNGSANSIKRSTWNKHFLNVNSSGLGINAWLNSEVGNSTSFPVYGNFTFSGTFIFDIASYYYEEGYSDGYDFGYEEGEATGQRLYVNGQYTGLAIFTRRYYLEDLAKGIVDGDFPHPTNGEIYLIDTNANYTIYIKWTWEANNRKTYFQTDGNTIIGELYWVDVAQGNWSRSWFGYYDQELHYFTSQAHYANLGVLETSFYPEVYICSTFQGDPNLYFFGSGNAYQMGFADGQTYTIQASETYNNVFNIFTPAFRAVANFFNLNIGPFKIWYFFAIPLIVSLLILVLRLVKH